MSGLLLLAISLFGCVENNRREDLLGAWKVDSTYSYYNGFEYKQLDSGSDWATYVYGKDGIMKEIKYNSYQSYFFLWCGADSLCLRSTQGSEVLGFKVLVLDENHLTLKKQKKPIFPGAGQKRFEIRYMSKTEIPKGDLMPFRDPRK